MSESLKCSICSVAKSPDAYTIKPIGKLFLVCTRCLEKRQEDRATLSALHATDASSPCQLNETLLDLEPASQASVYLPQKENREINGEEEETMVTAPPIKVSSVFSELQFLFVDRK